MDASDKWPVTLVYPGNPSDETMTFADRREVSGLKISFHVTIAAGGRTIDDLRFEQVLANPEIGKRDFTR